ncbi:DUF7668 domain-containing protein [Actinomadura miaoliensis]
MLPPAALGVVRTVVSLLVDGRHEELETLTEGRRLSAARTERAVREYGGDLISPPDEAFADADVRESEDGTGYTVAMPLWTAQEGRCRLEVRLTLREVAEDVWTVQIDALRVP